MALYPQMTTTAMLRLAPAYWRRQERIAQMQAQATLGMLGKALNGMQSVRTSRESGKIGAAQMIAMVESGSG